MGSSRGKKEKLAGGIDRSGSLFKERKKTAAKDERLKDDRGCWKVRGRVLEGRLVNPHTKRTDGIWRRRFLRGKRRGGEKIVRRGIIKKKKREKVNI